MFDHLIDENRSELENVDGWQVLSNNQDFIKELIVGRQADQPERMVRTLTLPTKGLVLSQQTGWYNYSPKIGECTMSRPIPTEEFVQ